MEGIELMLMTNQLVYISHMNVYTICNAALMSDVLRTEYASTELHYKNTFLCVANLSILNIQKLYVIFVTF